MDWIILCYTVDVEIFFFSLRKNLAHFLHLWNVLDKLDEIAVVC